MKISDMRRVLPLMEKLVDGKCPCDKCECGCLAHAVTVYLARDYGDYRSFRIDICGHCANGDCVDGS